MHALSAGAVPPRQTAFIRVLLCTGVRLSTARYSRAEEVSVE